MVEYTPRCLCDGEAIELKTDSYDNGNIYIETLSNRLTGTKGYIYKSKAYWLYYYYINIRLLWEFKMGALRNWFDENKDKYILFRKVVYNNGYTSEGYAIPLLDVLHDLEKDEDYQHKVI